MTDVRRLNIRDAVANIKSELKEAGRQRNISKLYIGGLGSQKTVAEEIYHCLTLVDLIGRMLNLQSTSSLHVYINTYELLTIIANNLSTAIASANKNNREASVAFLSVLQTKISPFLNQALSWYMSKIQEINPVAMTAHQVREALDAVKTKKQDLRNILKTKIDAVSQSNQGDNDKIFAIGIYLAKAYAQIRKDDFSSHLGDESIVLISTTKLSADSPTAGDLMLAFLNPIINNEIWPQLNNPSGIEAMQAILANTALSTGERIRSLIDKAIAIKDKNPYDPKLFSESGKGRTSLTQVLYNALARMKFSELKKLDEHLNPKPKDLSLSGKH